MEKIATTEAAKIVGGFSLISYSAITPGVDAQGNPVCTAQITMRDVYGQPVEDKGTVYIPLGFCHLLLNVMRNPSPVQHG